jgi:peroxiredoxin
MDGVLGALVLLVAQPPFAPVPQASEDSLRFAAKLPEFEAKDIGGRTWTLEDLRGKFTVIYFWRTGWAREADAHPRADPDFLDLAELQRFYDKKNVQALSFCMDYDYTHAAIYMKEKKYTFPVIADWVLIKKLFPGTEGGRLYWVVNPEGRLSYPFRSWSFGRLLFEVEKAAGQN